MISFPRGRDKHLFIRVFEIVDPPDTDGRTDMNS